MESTPRKKLDETMIPMEKAEKKKHPQRDLMKIVCNIIFIFGGGNFWYEDRNLSRFQQMLYNIYAVTFNFYLVLIDLNQISANFFRELTNKEQNDLIQFTIAHSHVTFKIFMTYLAKKRVKVFLKRILEENREFAVLEIDLQSVKTAKRYCISLVLILFFCLFSALIDGIMVHLEQGKLDFGMKMSKKRFPKSMIKCYTYWLVLYL